MSKKSLIRSMCQQITLLTKPVFYVVVSILVVIQIYYSSVTFDVFGQQKKKGYWQEVDCNKTDDFRTEEIEFQCCKGKVENEDGSGRYLELWCNNNILKDGKYYYGEYKQIYKE